MGLEGEGSGGREGEKWGERGREVGIGYPLSTPSLKTKIKIILTLIKHLVIVAHKFRLS